MYMVVVVACDCWYHVVVALARQMPRHLATGTPADYVAIIVILLVGGCF